MKHPLIAILVCSVFSTLSAANFKDQNQFTPGEEQYRLYVKFRPELGTDVESGIPVFARASRSATSELSTKISGLRFSQLITFTPEEKFAVRSGRSLRSVSGFDKSQFSGLLEVQGASLMPKESLLLLANQLESLDQVEYCELTPLTPPTPPSMPQENYTPPTSQSWVDKQFYLYGDQGAGVSGIYADHAWGLGITGQGVSIADIEWGWDYLHEEFNDPSKFVDALTTTNHSYDDHGTAVLGEMMATDNGFGVTGAVHGADKFYGFSEITKGRPAAILMALDSLEKGDILVFEMQTGGFDIDGDGETYVPADYSQSVWDVAKQAVEAGIIVVAAAGNGNEDLDNTAYSSYMSRGDNGTIYSGGRHQIGA